MYEAYALRRFFGGALLASIILWGALSLFSKSMYAKGELERKPNDESVIILFSDAVPVYMAPIKQHFLTDVARSARSSLSVNGVRILTLKDASYYFEKESLAECSNPDCICKLVPEARVYPLNLHIESVPGGINTKVALFECGQTQDAKPSLLRNDMRLYNSGLAGITDDLGGMCAHMVEEGIGHRSFEPLQSSAASHEGSKSEPKSIKDYESQIETAPIMPPVKKFVSGGEVRIDTGLNDSKPVKKSVSPFFMDESFVTVGMYDLCIKAGKCRPIDYSSCKVSVYGYEWNTQDRLSIARKYFVKPDMPVVCVSKYDAESFCKWQGGRLPTEAEYLRAARADTANQFPWGNELPNPSFAKFCFSGKDCASASSNRIKGFPFVVPAGFYSNNRGSFGLLQMVGNVWQWCSNLDAEVTEASNPIPEPLFPKRERLIALHGGSWASPSNDLRVWKRFAVLPDLRSFDIGFRCVQNAK